MMSTNTDRQTPDRVAPDILLEYVRRFGSHSLAYSTLQSDLAHFFIPQLGFIAYRTWEKYTVVLSNPVCDPKRRMLLLEQFLGKHQKPVFLHVSTGTASDLSQLGFRCNVMGVESWLDLQRFDPTWGSHNALRESARRFHRIKADIFECRFSDLAERGLDRAEIAAISERWLGERPGEEMRFLLRPLRLEDEPDTRVFFMRADNRLVGFTLYDPIYQDNTIIGYCPNISRWDDRKIPTGRSAAVNLHAAEVFSSEGKRTLALGLLPFAGDLISPFPDSRLLRISFLLSPHAITKFDFQSLSAHKLQYKGDPTHVFYATQRSGLSALRELTAVSRMIGIL